MTMCCSLYINLSGSGLKTRAELRSDQLIWIEEMKGVNKVMFMHSLEKILINVAGSASDDGSEAACRENLSHSKHRGYLVALKKQTSGVWLCGDTWELQSDNQGNFHVLSCNAFSCNLLQAAHLYTPQLLWWLCSVMQLVERSRPWPRVLVIVAQGETQFVNIHLCANGD